MTGEKKLVPREKVHSCSRGCFCVADPLNTSEEKARRDPYCRRHRSVFFFFLFFFFLPSHVHTTRIYFSFFPFSPYDPFSFRGGAARSSLEYERLFLGACTVLTACQCFRRRTWCLCQLAVGIRRPSTRHVGCRFFAVASETND